MFYSFPTGEIKCPEFYKYNLWSDCVSLNFIFIAIGVKISNIQLHIMRNEWELTFVDKLGLRPG